MRPNKLAGSMIIIKPNIRQASSNAEQLSVKPGLLLLQETKV